MTGTQDSKLTLAKGAKKEVPSLVDMVRKDPELFEFFKLIHQQDLREKALELLNRRMEN